MTSTTTGKSELTAEFVNPIIGSTISVFEMMLGCTPKRTGLSLKADHIPEHELSAVIGISGKAAGTLVLSLSKSVGIGIWIAWSVFHQMKSMTRSVMPFVN